MLRFKLILWLNVAFLVLLLVLAFKASKGGDEESTWKVRGLMRGDPSGERKDISTSGSELRSSGSDYLSSNYVQDTSTMHHHQDGDGEMGSIKVSVTVPSIYNKKFILNNKSINQSQSPQVYKARKSQISKTCRKYGLGRFQPTAGSNIGVEYQEQEQMHLMPVENALVWEQKWHMLYCWIHKVASSTWSQLFFNLHGKKVPVSRLHEAAQYFHPDSARVSEAVSNSLVFTFVRHPFERLVSAYRDKFELARKYSYVYSQYVTKILNIDNKQARVSHGLNSRRPTFKEFVNYLIKEDVHKYNDHWIPYWLHCHLCQMEYDIIGKMDTWDQDVNLITDVTGLSTTNVTLTWTRRRSNSSSQIALDYFSQLNKHSVKQLYQIYKIDFEMFEYSVQPYFDLFEP